MVWESILQAMRQMHWAEIGAVLAGIVYVVLAGRESVWCWLFGIVGSALSIYLFYTSQLYAESALYAYYVVAGVYGWYAWTHDRLGARNRQMVITAWPLSRHLIWIGIGVGLSLLLGYGLKTYTNAKFPIIDAHTTIFSLIATYLVTRKVLSNWVYWIVIDAVSAGLYAARDLFLYALLMVAYTGIAVWGYRQWRHHYKQQERASD